MDEIKRELVKAWLIKATHDLAAAEKLGQDPDSYLDVAIYHCQQAVEKALKGFLAFYDEDFSKTHDLRALTAQACQLEASFSDWQREASLLTPYAVEFRYPGPLLEPSREEFDEASSAAKHMYEHILKLLPPSVQPTP